MNPDEIIKDYVKHDNSPSYGKGQIYKTFLKKCTTSQLSSGKKREELKKIRPAKKIYIQEPNAGNWKINPFMILL